jgi:hypothetical protein
MVGLGAMVLLLVGCGDRGNDGLPAVGTSDNVRILSGRADAGSDGLSIETGEFTYGGGFGFSWTDAAGTWHEDGRPECLPEGASRRVTFAVTEVTVDGRTWRPIVWLDCR